MRLGIAHHFGWAVAVTSSAGLEVADRRRIELLGPGLPAAPIHHEGGAHPLHQHGERLDDAALGALVEKVRASAYETASAALAHLEGDLPEPIVSMSLRAWPVDFPEDIAVLRRAPFESRADSVMYREVLAEVGRDRGWRLHLFEARDVEQQALAHLGPRGRLVLDKPRAVLGPPWSKDHRTAFAATILAG